MQVGDKVKVSRKHNSIWCNATMKVTIIYEGRDGWACCKHPTYGEGAFPIAELKIQPQKKKKAK